MITKWLGYKFFNVLLILFILIISVSVSPFVRMAHASAGNTLASVDLAGTWTFTPLGQSATTITVPGGGWYKQGFTTVNEADYQRSITVPNAGVPQTTIIEFGAVNYQAALYINNTLVGTNTTAFLPSEFDISNYVTPGNTYALKVHVKGKAAMMSGGHSTVPDAANWQAAQTQGIFRSAFLKVYPQIYISDEFVRPSVTSTSLSYDVWVRNNSSTAQSMVISSSLSSWNGDAWAYPTIADKSFTAAANATTKVTVGPISWNLGTASYWWPNVPYVSGYTAKLHNLNLSLKQNAVVTQTQSVRFGFREFKQASNGSRTYYYLNGVRVNLRGDNLQTQNYDGINYGGGKGDAMGTYPGFLPGASGWPKAVDNYLKLNYNVVRMHQIPSTPYMSDVTDEKGLMVIQETAIRGPSDQDFNNTANFVGHVTQMVTRDKDHPSIVKWSISNEADAPNSIVVATAAIQTAWYNAAKAVDPTRPINIDTTADMYNTMTFSDLSVLRHYGNGFGVFTDNVFTRTDRPFGEGEFIWPHDNSKQGFTWFATSMQAMRRQDASDVRPYTLLSAWASLIPWREDH
jgi:beta-galactosidase/beta-glucuronidase